MRNWFKLLVVTTVTAAGVAVAATPAHASIPSDCNTNTGWYFCVFTSSSYTGSVRKYDLIGGCLNISAPFDQNVSSVANGGIGHAMSIYTSYNCTGTRRNIYVGEHYAHMSSIPGGFPDNDASSISFANYNP